MHRKILLKTIKNKDQAIAFDYRHAFSWLNLLEYQRKMTLNLNIIYGNAENQIRVLYVIKNYLFLLKNLISSKNLYMFFTHSI